MVIVSRNNFKDEDSCVLCGGGKYIHRACFPLHWLALFWSLKIFRDTMTMHIVGIFVKISTTPAIKWILRPFATRCDQLSRIFLAQKVLFSKFFEKLKKKNSKKFNSSIVNSLKWCHATSWKFRPVYCANGQKTLPYHYWVATFLTGAEGVDPMQFYL